MLSEVDEVWEPFVQTSLRSSLHGGDLARAVVAAGIIFVESNIVPEYIDVMLPGPNVAFPLYFSCFSDSAIQIRLSES
jgi:hypothetical protein